MLVRVLWLREKVDLLARFIGMKNNCAQEVLLGALVAGADKGFLIEALALTTLSHVTLFRVLISRKPTSPPRLSHVPTYCLADDMGT